MPNTIHLAGPDNETFANAKSRDAARTPMPTLPSPTTPRRVRVAAMVSTRADGSEFTTYNVEEIPDAAEQIGKTASPPLLGCRRSRSRSQSSIRSDDSLLRTPSPSILGSPTLTLPVTPPGAPRIGCLPSPKLDNEQFAFPYLEWAAYDSDSSSSKAARVMHASRFDPFADEEEPYYHLPTDLFSPELEMSEAEFKESVLRWMVRRKNEKAHKDAESD